MKSNYLKSSLGLLLAAGMMSSSFADTASFRVGAGSWDHDPSGYIRYTSGGGGTNADLDQDLNLKADKEGYAFVQIEHPVPLFPNVRIQSTALKNTGSGTITSTFTYGGSTFSASQPITSELTLDHTDVTLYWQLLDNIVSLDLGLTGKILDAKATLTSGGTTETNTFDGVLPMGYVGVGISPMEGLEIRGDLHAISVGDNSVTDFTAKVSYTTDYLLGIEAGVRTITLELDDADAVFSNMEFKGPFIGAYLHF